jgi:hypothetical protein
MESDVAYFVRRAGEEREAAMKAAHLNARQAHLEMARRYDDLAQSITAREKHLSANLCHRVIAS